MRKNVEAILRGAAQRIQNLKTCIELGGDQTAQNMWRGTVNGMLEAAKILTGNSYDWDSDGIYENGSNEPVVKA